MSRSVAVTIAVLLAFSAVPASAQSNAQYCIDGGVSCQYLKDEGFEATSQVPWYYSSGSYRRGDTPDPCAWNGGQTGAAELLPGGTVTQYVTTDSFPYWRLRLDVYKPAITTADDKFLITIASYTHSETKEVDLSAYGECAGVINVPFDEDWGNQYVAVEIRRHPNSTSTMYVDNVSLFGSLISN